VPQTFPMKPINGIAVGSFLAPSVQSEFTFPSSLREEILSIAPRYELDVRNFRTPDKDWLVQQLWDMTEMRFKALNHMMDHYEWDYFMWVEMGVDRIHHGLWSYMDPGHRRYQPGNKFENTIREYYKMIDTQLHTMLSKIDDNTVVLVVSDRQENGWWHRDQRGLWRNGYLVLKKTRRKIRSTRMATAS
jgi:predicted AlkP superfamily phosphohydrolase/phosphomutase